MVPVPDRTILITQTDSKSYVICRILPFLVTLNDP